jgi:hypothetical protein
MPRKATGRRQGRPGRWEWWRPLKLDEDWWVLQQMLWAIPDPDGPIETRALARQALSNFGFSDGKIAITKIERKFESLLVEAIMRLSSKATEPTNKEVIEEAKSILDNCLAWQGITAEEHRIIEAADVIWEKILKRQAR